MDTLSSPQYIVPLFRRGRFCGTGFIVGDILITAGHVMNNGKPRCKPRVLNEISALICDERLNYNPKMFFFDYQSDDDNVTNHADIAAFRIPKDIASKVNSPLKLSSSDVFSEQIARSYYFLPSDNEVGYVYGETDLIVTRQHALSNMFSGAEWPTCFNGLTYDKLTHGASGSPVIDQNNNVLGVLIIGYDSFKFDESIVADSGFSREQLEDYQKTCLFFKGSMIDYLFKYHRQLANKNTI